MDNREFLPDDPTLLSYEQLSEPERVAREERVAAELARLSATELSKKTRTMPLAKIVGEDRNYHVTYNTLLQIAEADSTRQLPSDSSTMVA